PVENSLTNENQFRIKPGSDLSYRSIIDAKDGYQVLIRSWFAYAQFPDSIAKRPQIL
ncbi:MAG: hypothetical protein H6Q47_257, partial [Deltaproteobacteria bacterium]|nr:hypothetical protein [Deltaproteobacteria bacterium]